MSTSLAEQLKRLAVPQTSALKRDKTRPSLLFDPREAAGLRRETVYQIGLDGLEELIAKNPIFEQFRSTLFDITAKNFERSIHTTEANTKLDKKIRQFLLLLSPYFLLTSTHKTLEWLINRFNIQEYNREDLLMLILPYHESNIFVRVIQLIKFTYSNDKWLFLKSLQKAGVHLTKQSLLTRAANDVYFLKFVSKFISLLTKEYDKPSQLTVAFNFYCSVFTGAIEYSKEINESQVTEMLPAVIKGLKSNIPDYCAGSYVITAKLMTKVAISELLLDKIVERISTINVESLKTEAVLVMLTIYQTQNHYNRVSDEALINLVKLTWLPQILEDLNGQNCLIWPFLEPLFKGCVRTGFKSDDAAHRDYVEKLLNAIKFDDPFVGRFLEAFLDGVGKWKSSDPQPLKLWLKKIIELVERQYPTEFDKEIYKILSSTDEGITNKRKKCLQKIFKQGMALKGKFDVFDKLYHPNPQFRVQAVEYLTKNFKLLRQGEKEMIKSSIIDRLNDDSVLVVEETLTLIQNISILDKISLRKVLIKLAGKCQKDLKSWGKIVGKISILLCCNSESNDWESFLSIFPTLLPITDDELKIAVEIFKTDFIQKHPLKKLQGIKYGSIDAPDEFSNLVIEGLESDNLELIKEFVEVLQKTPNEDRDVFHKYLATLLLSCMLPENSPIEINSLVIEIFACYFDCKSAFKPGNILYRYHFELARKGKFSLEGFLSYIKKVIIKTTKTDIDLGKRDFSIDNHFNRYFANLANLLFYNNSGYKKYYKQFLNYFFSDIKQKIEFMLNLILSNNACLDQNFVDNTTDLIIVLLEESQSLKDFVEIDGILVPYLLLLLMNSSEIIRRKTLKIIEILSEKIENKCHNYYWLLRELSNQKEEIILDEEQMPLVIFNLLQPSKYRARNSKITPYRNGLIQACCNKDNPIYFQAGILKLLSHINSIDLFEQISRLVLDLLEGETVFDTVKSSIIINTINRCDPNIACFIKLDGNVWKLITTLVKNDTIKVIDGENSQYVTVLILNQFDKEFMSNLSEEIAKNLLDIIIETTTITQNTEVLPAATHIFKHMDLDGRLIVNYFVNMKNVQSPKLDPNKLKRRVNIVPTIDILDTMEWRKGVAVLEFIQDKKKIRYLEILFPVLFDVLKKCLDFDEQSAVEYPKQLILSSILHCCNKLEKTAIPENAFNVELIVQCIRASQNPQTHHHALLVLAQSATLIPTQVLHHIMAIFTFMGSSVLRHDDAYSYQIISKIIDSIIPLLVEGDTTEAIAKVLRVFVDALLDVPEHRRMPLYKRLLSKIGVKDHLYIFLLLIFESQVFNSNQLRTKDKSEDSKKRLEIAASFCCEFSPYIVINNCISLLKFLKELPDEISDSGSDQFSFSIRFNNAKQFRHFKYILITFTANLLGSKEFVNQVAALKDEEAFALEIEYKDVIVNILTYIQRVSKVAEKNSNTLQAQYWKVILHHSYDILDSVNALLTPQMFVLVIKGLMIHNLNTVKRRAMEVLNAKLQYNSYFFEKCKENDIYSVIPPLISIIKMIEQPELESDQELLVQTALLSIKLIVKLLAAQNPKKFIDILDFVTELIKSNKAQNNVLASIVLCLAELCVNLRAHSIASLPNFMPSLIRILKQQKRQESPNLLLLSTLTALQKIVDTLHNFMSPYLEKILIELSSFSISSDDQKMQPFINKVKLIREKIATTIPPRILLPTIKDGYNTLIEKSLFTTVGSLMLILKEALSHLNGSDISANLADLTEFFLNALQFRSDGKASFTETNLIENQIVTTFSTFGLKLSESTFRPLYQDVFHWAQVADERLITFYHLSSEIASNLKGLFVLFANQFINNSAQILKDCTKFDEEEKNLLLLEYVLKTLLNVFTYDSHKFVNKERFEILMPVIVDQLENTLGGIEIFEKRSRNLVIPCIVHFTVAAADDSLWKRLNYAVLLKSKNKSPTIRLLTLNCLTEIVTKVGEDFLPLLPETIPFLAELLEDEEEIVEKECRKSVQTLEKILGEPIQKYF